MSKIHRPATPKRRNSAPKRSHRTVVVDTASGRPNSIRVDKKGDVTLDAATRQVFDQKIIENMRKSGWLVEKLSNSNFGQSVRSMVVAYEADQFSALINNFAGVSDGVVAKIRNGNPTAIGTVAGTPQYDGLPQAAQSAANAVENYPIQTNNAHADSAALAKGGGDLGNLLSLGQVFGTGTDTVNRTAAPLARDLAGTVSEVCLVVQEELPVNPGLGRTLEDALEYTTVRSAKGQQTKKKIAKAKGKVGKETGKAAGTGGAGDAGGATASASGNAGGATAGQAPRLG